MNKLYLLYTVLVLNAILLPSGWNYVSVGVGSFELIEFVVIIILVIEIIKLVKNKSVLKDVLLINTSKKQIIAFFIFVSLVAISFIIGLINRNTFLFSQSRGLFMYIATFFILLMNVNVDNDKAQKIFGYFMNLLSIASLLIILSYFSPLFGKLYESFSIIDSPYTKFIIAPSGFRGVYNLSITSLTAFLYYYYMSKILFAPKKITYYMRALIGLLATTLYFQKPIVVSFLIGNIILFGLYVIHQKNTKSIIVVSKFIIMIFLIIIITLSLLPEGTINQISDYIIYGWLNIGRGTLEGDLSTGRFDLWYKYGSESLRGLGFSPYGIGKALVTAEHTNPHNILVFLAYNSGLFSVITYMYMNISFIGQGFRVIRKKDIKIDPNNLISIFTLIVFLTTIFIQSLYGGTLDSNYTYIFMFSSMSVWLLFFTRNYFVNNEEV